MNDFNTLLKRIEETTFFSALGQNNISLDNLILMPDVGSVFIRPDLDKFQGLYEKTFWLPSSLGQDDPFYRKINNEPNVLEKRKIINKAVLLSLKKCDMAKLRCSPHDFSVTARNAVCFAFRQMVSECYYALGDVWSRIIEVYFLGHWPVGYAEKKIIAI